KMFKKGQDHAPERRQFRFNWSTLLIGLVGFAGLLAVIIWWKEIRSIHPNEVLRYLYIVSAVLFILGLKGLSSPKYARRGMFLAEVGILVAMLGTRFH